MRGGPPMGRTATWQPQETAGNQPNAAARSRIGESLLLPTLGRMPVALTLKPSSPHQTRRRVLVRNGYGPIFRSGPIFASPLAHLVCARVSSSLFPRLLPPSTSTS